MNCLSALKKRLASFQWIGYLAAFIVVAVYYGLCRIENVDFICTNGDYQSYNAFRRILDGQIPYKDFANYLGIGPILLCVPLLWLHNSFAGSLFVTNFVATFCFMLLVSLLFYLVTGHKLMSVMAGLLLPKLISGSFMMMIPVYGYYTTVYLQRLVQPGNSFRPVRMFLPILLCVLALLWMRRLRRKGADKTLRKEVATAKGAAVLGFAVGMGVTWSNDFGFACIGSATLVLLILTIADRVQNGKYVSWGGNGPLLFGRFLFYLPALVLGVFCSVLLASAGNPKSWLDFTTGTADWQFWYYGIYVHEKVFSLTDLLNWKKYHRLWVHMGIYLAVMGVCLYRLCRKKENDRLILFVFLFTSFVAGQFVYIIGSGANGFDEGVIGLVILLFWALVCKGVMWLARRLRLQTAAQWAVAGVTACYVAFMLYSAAAQWNNLRQMELKKQPGYVAQLEGVTADAFDLQEMEQIVGTTPLFSTYATALDDMLDVFQPTGSDYIIHAMGYESNARYVQIFEDGNYGFVQTTNFFVWPWEAWTMSASWDFYRELFLDYNVHSDHGKWTLWEYAGENANLLNAKTQVQIIPHSEHETEILVTVDTDVPCYVDVTVTWENAYVMNGYRLQTWNNVVFVEHDPRLQTIRAAAGDGYYRPAQGTHHLMVYVENGIGSIVLNGRPAECTRLTVTEAVAGEVIRFQR